MPRLPIAREGFPYIGGLLAAALVAYLIGWEVTAGIAALTALLVLNFFRDPERTVPTTPGAVVAPADGRLVYVGQVEEAPFLPGAALKISIFMSIFDVHVNRIPYSGEVTEVAYRRGQFLAADKDEASSRNEQNAVVLAVARNESGDEKITVVQVAGLIARRIVCWVQPGDRVQRGQRFGLIRFGSRLDLFVPRWYRPAVTVGQRVKAGESVVCHRVKEGTSPEIAT